MNKIQQYFKATHQGPYVHVAILGQQLGLFDKGEGEAAALAKQLRDLAQELDPLPLFPEVSGSDRSPLPPFTTERTL